MSKYKANIRIAKEPMKIIKWFTKHFDKEIGALGLGEMIDGELFVEKLVFPTQTVNGSHVHFKPEDWIPIVSELTDEEMSKIIFYWHKHPSNSPGASQGDEEDTFDVFMDENSGRSFFGFLQTAKNYTDGIKYEARIEMRDPLWVSITDCALITDEDDEIEETCKKIIEDKVTEGNLGASDQPGTEKIKKGKQDDYGYDFVKNPNDILKIRMKDGCIKILMNTTLESYFLEFIEDPALKEKIAKQDVTYEKNGQVLLTIQPKKKKIKQVYNILKKMEEYYSGEYIEEEPEDDKNKFTSYKTEHTENLDNYGNNNHDYSGKSNYKF